MAHRIGKVRIGGKRREAARRAAARAEAPRVSLYEEVTATIIAQLEKGVFPWVQPWSAAAAGVGLPRNAVTGRPYSGINVLILSGAVIEGGYAAQDWLTFRQALAAGGCVRKGQRGRTIFYADRFTPKAEGGHEQVSPQPDEAARSIPFLKRFTVFNVAQCDGLPERFTAEPSPTTDYKPHQAADELIVACGADFRIGGGQAYYSPIGDYVQVPPQAAFAQSQDYYDVALHELGHWTGSKERLARNQSGRRVSSPPPTGLLPVLTHDCLRRVDRFAGRNQSLQCYSRIPSGWIRPLWRQVCAYLRLNILVCAAAGNFGNATAVHAEPCRNVMLTITTRQHSFNDGSIAFGQTNAARVCSLSHVHLLKPLVRA